MIAGCALNEIGPLKMPGECCVTCLPMATTGATTTSELPPPETTQGTTTTAQPTCVSDPSCFCQEDCAVPTKCVDTVACCESFECPESYERINGACIQRTGCVEPTSSPTPKCTYPMLSGTDLVQDITASSYFAAEGVEEHRPSKVTKNGRGWMVDPSNDRDRELTVAFSKPIELTGLSIKQAYIVAFIVFTSTDGVDFTPYSEPNEVYFDRNTGKPAKTFQGKDFPGNRFRTVFFRAPLTATHFRITITDVDSSPNRDLNFPKLNLEVLGCHEDVPVLCQLVDGMERLDSSMIVGTPTVEDSPVSDIRGYRGWQVPLSSPIEPSVTAIFSNTESFLVSQVAITGNADKIELSYTQGESADPIQLGSAEYVEDRSTPDSRTIIFKPFIRANSVTITAKKAIDNQQDSFNLHLSIYGCFDSAEQCATERTLINRNHLRQ